LTALCEVWAVLQGVRSLEFEAHSQAVTGWDGIGTGSVAVSEPAAGVIVFEETGTWKAPARREVRFTNSFRWSAVGESLRLEHLRFGPNKPVLLFDMAPDENGVWREISPHQCREDCYSASLAVQGKELLVAWVVQGPRKQESIRYRYW
jgi:hypothetical protein